MGDLEIHNLVEEISKYADASLQVTEYNCF